MKLFLVVLGVTGALATPPVHYEPIITDYHGQIGIPEAARIKAAEAAMDFDGSRIAGGSAANLGQFPFMGGLLIDLVGGGQSVCGSSLISSNRVLTAAHCWETRQHQGSMVTVVLGSIYLFSGGIRISSNNVQIHEGYNVDRLNNDIAVIVISNVDYNNNIRSIELFSGSNQFAGDTATAIGFGRTGDSSAGNINTNQALRHVDLHVITNDECGRIYGFSVIVASMLCVRGADRRSICSGDLGGPLVINNELVGVTSFVAAAGCERGFPAGFARVSFFNSWIRAHM